MPNPDGTIKSRDIGDNEVTSRALDDDLTLDGETTVTKLVVTERINVVATLLVDDGTGQFSVDSSLFSDTTVIRINRGYTTPASIEVGDAAGTQRLLISAPFDTTPANRATIHIYGDDNGAFTGDILLNPGATGAVTVGGPLLAVGELVIPAVTADPSSPADGNMWLHTVDNALYIWEGGAKRTVASW